jgi:serine palmitoyltransferase
MGYATNAFGIPAIGGHGTLLVSDSLNHNSIVAGARASGATIRVYKHNDYHGLESMVRAMVSNLTWRKSAWPECVAIETASFLSILRCDEYSRCLQLRSSIIDGQERTQRPWRKIVVLAEGVYSMEGEMVDL